MLVIEFLEPNKLYNLDQKIKMFIILVFLSTIFLIISLLTLIWMPPYFLYGTLYGLLGLYSSFLLIVLIIKLFKNKSVSRMYGILLYFVRISWFTLFFCLGVFLINPLLSDEKGVELLLRPINIFTFLAVYTLYVWSVYFLPIYDLILRKLIDKKIMKKSTSDMEKGE